MQIDFNFKRSDVTINKEHSIRLFYIDKYRYKTRKEANEIAFKEAIKTKASDVWYITPKGDNNFDDYYRLIREQITLDLINGRYLKQWIYVIEYNLHKSDRNTSLFKGKMWCK